MEFETVQIGNVFYVKKNGVMGTSCVAPMKGSDEWGVFICSLRHFMATKEQALTFLAEQMDTWYTATEAAARLVEMGVFGEPPSAQRMTKWCREGLLPGAIKVRALRGSGGAWRISASALQAFAERRGQ